MDDARCGCSGPVGKDRRGEGCLAFPSIQAVTDYGSSPDVPETSGTTITNQEAIHGAQTWGYL